MNTAGYDSDTTIPTKIRPALATFDLTFSISLRRQSSKSKEIKSITAAFLVITVSIFFFNNH